MNLAEGMTDKQVESGAAGITRPAVEDEIIKCIDCGEDFVWTAGEQIFFHDKGLQNPPKRCKPCKQAKTDRLAAIAAAQAGGARQRVEVAVRCARCDQQTTVPFYPSQGRPVFCRSCFLAQNEASGARPGHDTGARTDET